jgi:hypothetical protein
MSSYSEILLWLFVLNLGVALGAGLYETRMVLPQWFGPTATGYPANAEAMHTLDAGRRFWGMVTTLPLTLLTLANLALAWSATGPRQFWWLAAALLTLLERLGTFGFFIPTALALQRPTPLPVAQAHRLVAWWRGLNYLRLLLNLLALLAALRVLSRW